MYALKNSLQQCIDIDCIMVIYHSCTFTKQCQLYADNPRPHTTEKILRTLNTFTINALIYKN